MTTARLLIGRALRLLGATQLLDAPTAEELVVGLSALQDLVLALHEARGPLVTLDITGPLSGPVVPGENQRLRIQSGTTVAVTLPNSVALFGGYDPYDYGFGGAYMNDPQVFPPSGSTGPADWVAWRPPQDGARIEIVGTQSGLYFYREDTNAWVSALGLTLDGETPLNARYDGDVAALLAERAADELSRGPMTPALMDRIRKGREALMTRTGTHRRETRGQYF